VRGRLLGTIRPPGAQCPLSGRTSWHTDRVAADPIPAGPLDPVFACPGCGCLVVDQDVHTRACSPIATGQSLAAQIIDWLDGLDPAELEQRAYAGAALDAEPTAAILAELRRQAAEL
jgi:hypothetical protein